MRVPPIMPSADDALSFRMARREMVKLLRNHSWQESALGEPLSWPRQLQQLVELIFNSPVPSFILCGAERTLLYNSSFAKICGARHPQIFGLPFARAFPEFSRLVVYVDHAFQDAPTVIRDIEWPISAANKSHTDIVDIALTPVTNGALKVEWIEGQIVRTRCRDDMSARRANAADRTLLHSEVTSPENAGELRLAVEVARLAMWDWDIETDAIVWSDEHFRMGGYEVGEVQPSFTNWSARIHPDDLASTLAALGSARETRTIYRHEFRFLHPDGNIVWSSALGLFFYDDGGEAIRMIGVMQDVTDRREAEERQKLTVSELQHRTRNLISLTQALAGRTLDRSSSINDFRERFGHRLSALSRVQEFLCHMEQGSSVTFDELLRAELSAHGAIERSEFEERMTLEGPTDVHLHSSTLQTFALALHELATNATKYGALKDGGHLHIRWHVEQAELALPPTLHVEWLETGVDMPAAGTTSIGSGYGRELIERALPYQLNAETHFEMRADGIRCTIAVPILVRWDYKAKAEASA